MFCWLLFAGVFTTLWVGAFLLSRWGARPMSVVGGVVFVLLSLVGVYFVGRITVGLIRVSTPSVVFERSFGFKPTPDVSNIKSSYWYFADTGLIYLEFKTSPETLQRIIDRGLKTTTAENFKSILTSGLSKSGPRWWEPLKDASAQFFYAERKPDTMASQDFASETELLSYNPRTGLVFYCFSGID